MEAKGFWLVPGPAVEMLNAMGPSCPPNSRNREVHGPGGSSQGRRQGVDTGEEGGRGAQAAEMGWQWEEAPHDRSC